MSVPGPSAALGPGPGVVDGVDVDAVAAAVRGCPGVDDLYSSTTASIASYLPGRQVAGVRVSADALTVQVRAAWAVPVTTIAAGIQRAVAPLGGGRRVDVVVADITDPTPAEPVTSAHTEGQPAWTIRAAPHDGNSSAQATPTMAVTPRLS